MRQYWESIETVLSLKTNYLSKLISLSLSWVYWESIETVLSLKTNSLTKLISLSLSWVIGRVLRLYWETVLSLVNRRQYCDSLEETVFRIGDSMETVLSLVIRRSLSPSWYVLRQACGIGERETTISWVSRHRLVWAHNLTSDYRLV
jgi:hypothetical protein